MAEPVFWCFFLVYSTTFRQNRRPFPGKPGGAAATNTAGKNSLLRGQNKAERNCRRTQEHSRKKQKLPHKNTVRQLFVFPFQQGFFPPLCDGSFLSFQKNAWIIDYNAENLGKRFRDRFQYGHSPRNENLPLRIFDVGVGANNFRPVSLDDIANLIELGTDQNNPDWSKL